MNSTYMEKYINSVSKVDKFIGKNPYQIFDHCVIRCYKLLNYDFKFLSTAHSVKKKKTEVG
jgi:hypothetical protein